MLLCRRIFHPETVMHSSLHVVTTFAVLVHTVLGCCVHHAHGAMGHAHAAGVPHHDEAACSAHDDHEHSLTCAADDHGRDHDPCRERHCDFIRPGGAQSQKVIAAFVLPLIEMVLPGAHFCEPEAIDGVPPELIALSLPRLHLVKQVLLL